MIVFIPYSHKNGRDDSAELIRLRTKVRSIPSNTLILRLEARRVRSACHVLDASSTAV